MLPVRINETVTIPFVLDSGASEVAIPDDVFSVLRRAGTITQGDFIGTGIYALAGGSLVTSDRYMLHKLSIGKYAVTNVIANVIPVKGDPLLGQSFLQRLPAWTLDNTQHALVLHDENAASAEPRTTEEPAISTPKEAVGAPSPDRRNNHSGASIEELFTYDMFNVQLPFLKSRVGVARRVFSFGGEQQRTYTVDGCEVAAFVRKNQVLGYSLWLGGSESWRPSKQNCNVGIPMTDHMRTNDLTFGKFIAAMGLGLAPPNDLFRASCLTACGNAADPTVEFHWDGPHAAGFIKIDLVTTLAYGRALDAATNWENLISSREGRNYVIAGKFNCDPKYESIGLQFFRDVEVSQIVMRFGERPKEPVISRVCAGGS